MEREGKKALRRGYTSGTCAAAGAKAAAHALFESVKAKGKALTGRLTVPVTLPRGGSLEIPVKSVSVEGDKARAVVIKDAGDDPDVTHKAEFVIEVALVRLNAGRAGIAVRGGEGVGVVTRPGLKVPVGRPAINPVPMRMIKTAVREAATEARLTPSVVVTVSVPKGRLLAERTMNGRLGIIGGISILGTTGIVEPMSLAAYRHSISCGIDVALASGLDEVVLSTGRTSEKVFEALFKLPGCAYILTGDHMGHALEYARGKKGLKRVTVAGQFGKFTKLAAGHFETHCSDAGVELDFVAHVCKRVGLKANAVKKVLAANTARGAFYIIKEEGGEKVFKEICSMVKKNAMKLAGRGMEIRAALAGYDNDAVAVC